MASYLGRNVNLTLLVIIIGVVIAMVGTTVFFQRSLQDKASSLEDTSGDLSTCQATLDNYKEKYSAAAQEANETAQDIRKYDQLYEQKVSELKDSQNTLLDTERQLEFEKLQKEKFQESYEAEQKRTQQLELTVQSRENEIDDLERENRDLRDDLAACQSGG